MNKQKFEEKCQELYTHEDEMYAKVLEYIKPFCDELAKYNCELKCEMFWSACNEDGKNSIFFDRIPIKKHYGYACNIRIVISLTKTDSALYEDNDAGLQIIDDVTKYTIHLFKGWIFRKYNCDFIFNDLKKYVYLIQQKGWEAVLKEIPN